MKASAPGKVLLCGEYAVLSGHPALVAAVNRRAYAQVTKSETQPSAFLRAARAEIVAHYGESSAPAQAIARVTVDTSSLTQRGQKLGLGSSAAATVAAVRAACPRDAPIDHIFALARRAHARAQSERGAAGSGADVAAACFGGVQRVQIRADGGLDCTPRVWPSSLQLVLIWTEVVADTTALIKKVAAFAHDRAEQHRAHMAALAETAHDFERALVAEPTAALAAVRDGAARLAELAKASGAPLVPPGFSALA